MTPTVTHPVVGKVKQWLMEFYRDSLTQYGQSDSLTSGAVFSVEVESRAITDGPRVGWKTGAAVPARVVVRAGVHRVRPDPLRKRKKRCYWRELVAHYPRFNGSFRFKTYSSAYEVHSRMSWLMYRVRLFNVGLHFLAAKVAFSCPSMDRFGKTIWGLKTLDQVKSVPNFC